LIDVQVQDRDNGFAPAQVVQLIDVLVRVVWMLDSDFGYAADHDTDGLWAATGKTVRQAFAEAGSNQFDAAMLPGISQPEFSIISRGMRVRTFTLRELAAVADFAGITLPTLSRRLAGCGQSFLIWELAAISECVGVGLAELVRRGSATA